MLRGSTVRLCLTFLLFETLESARLQSFSKGSSNHSSNNTQNPPVLADGYEQRVVAHPRENAALNCPINCDPPCIFHWTKNNEPVLQWERFYIPVDSQSILQIRAVKADDGGHYECRGVNGFGASVARLKLIVDGEDPSQSNQIKRTLPEGFRPVILIGSLPVQSVVTVSRGTNRVLTCEATGHPTPNVTWFKNNLSLLESSDNVATLRLTDLREQDSGNYRCIAENDFGKSFYEVKVKVEGGASSYGGGAQLVSLSPTNLTLHPTQTGAFTCTVRLEESLSKPMLLWVKRIQRLSDAENAFLHKGEPFELVNGTEVIQKSSNTYSTSLIFANVTKRKAGSYLCVLAGPALSSDFEFLEATLSVSFDTAKAETTRNRAAQVHWTLLWTFSFLFLSIFTIVCFLRLYGIRRKTKAKALPVARYTANASGNARIAAADAFASNRIAAPANSPGETISTTLTQQNEVYHPFIHSSSSYSRDFQDPAPSYCSYEEQRRGAAPERVPFDASSVSDSDSVYETISGFEPRNSPSDPHYLNVANGVRAPFFAGKVRPLPIASEL